MTITAKLYRLATVIDRIDTRCGGSHPAEPHIEEAAALVADLLAAVTDEPEPDSIRFLAAAHRRREGA